MLSNIVCYSKQIEQMYIQGPCFVCSRRICLRGSGLTYNPENDIWCYLKNSYYYGWLDKVIFFLKANRLKHDCQSILALTATMQHRASPHYLTHSNKVYYNMRYCCISNDIASWSCPEEAVAIIFFNVCVKINPAKIPSLFFLVPTFSIPSLKYTSMLLWCINIGKSQYKLNALISFTLEHLAAGTIINLQAQPEAHNSSTRTLLLFLEEMVF